MEKESYWLADQPAASDVVFPKGAWETNLVTKGDKFSAKECLIEVGIWDPYAKNLGPSFFRIYRLVQYKVWNGRTVS
jgi:hypothetical protein